MPGRLKDQVVGWTLTAALGVCAAAAIAAALVAAAIAVVAAPLATTVLGMVVAWALWRRLRRR